MYDNADAPTNFRMANVVIISSLSEGRKTCTGIVKLSRDRRV